MDNLMKTPLITALIAFVAVIVIGPITIKYLKKLKFGQTIRSDGPQRHLQKSGTPTMGGVIIMVGILVGTLVGDHSSYNILFALFITLAYSVLGLLDDLIIILTHSSQGLTARQKLLGQFAVALLVGLYGVFQLDSGTTLLIPFTDATITLSPVIYILLTLGVMVGTSNAVNLTDGLDGLAAGTTAIGAAAYAIVATVLGYYDIALFAGAITGACLGFAWFNAHPAAVFMGDTGSLGLGAALGVIAVLTRTQLILPLIGGIFVIEALSDIIQVGYFRLTNGKRVFRMAPLHHHFELLGWEEPKIMIRFWLIGLLFGALGLLAVL